MSITITVELCISYNLSHHYNVLSSTSTHTFLFYFNAEIAGAELLKPHRCRHCRVNQAERIFLFFLFLGLTDHSVLLSSLFFSVLSVYSMYCSSDVMDVHGTSL